VYDKSSKNKYLIFARAFNARVGAQPTDKFIGSEGEQTINNNGRSLIDFSLLNKLKITYTFFRHKNIHTFYWEARSTKSITEYIIINEKLKTTVRDIKVFSGSEINTDIDNDDNDDAIYHNHLQIHDIMAIMTLLTMMM
jgi:hypothetical protein